MELQQESFKVGAAPATTSRNLSSSSSAFVSAIQSPFFSPRSPKSHPSESNRSDITNLTTNCIVSGHPPHSASAVDKTESLSSINLSTFSTGKGPTVCTSPILQIKSGHQPSSPNDSCEKAPSNCTQETSNGYLEKKEKQRRWGKSRGKLSMTPSCASFTTSNRFRSCDVYIGIHGRKHTLKIFSNWLRAELELQGVSCFVADRARYRNAQRHDLVERAMDGCSFGVVIITKNSFGNPYSIDELRHFLEKKNLVPIFFDIGPGDCLARDIIEKRGDLWERHGGEVWNLYGGLEKEWKEAVDGLSRVEDWKLDAHEGNWRDCILRAVILLGTMLGRRSIVERMSRWVEKVEKNEFPFPRNDNFVGRKKEISELELILFGDVSDGGEREYFELKAKNKMKHLVISRNEEKGKSQEIPMANIKGKEPVVWKESEKEIEMQRGGNPPQRQNHPLRGKRRPSYGRRKRSMKTSYGKGVAIVSGESGIGKTELLLEFGYRFSQRYKMVLWVGGEAKYIRQNFLNLCTYLEVDISIENPISDKGKIKSFEEQEDIAIFRLRKELMRDIPYLVVIDNLENERDWWDQRLVMDLLPHFGRESHFIISTRLPRVMNFEPLKLSYLSGVEAMSLMKGRFKEFPVAEIDALRVIEEKLNRLTIGFGIVSSILSELPISPSRLLDTINRMPLRYMIWNDTEFRTLRRHTFLMQLLEVCFTIFDHADCPWSLATRMVHASGWFAPSAIPISLLASAAHKLPGKNQGAWLWKQCLRAVTFSFTKSHLMRSEAEAFSTLVRFGIARTSTKSLCIHIHEIVRLYACKRGTIDSAQAMVRSISNQGSVLNHSEHLWSACFLVFGLGFNKVTVGLEVHELVRFIKRIVLPLSIHAFVTFSRCNAALELLRHCTDTLEAAEKSLVSQAEKWMDKSLCWWRPDRSDAQSCLWQEVMLLNAIVLETRVKLMLRGGQYDLGDDLIRKAIFIRSSICGEEHPDTVSARELLSKLARLLSSIQCN